MLDLQRQGVHNINFVTPTHVVPQILESLPSAIEQGLDIPLVYNSGGYDSVETLRLLEGIIDIYMPDFKFADPGAAERYCRAPDYPEVAQAALREMHCQVGDLVLNQDRMAERGLLVRHLVMPEGQADTRQVMYFLAREISPHTYVNVMGQYHPAGDIAAFPELQRRITPVEYGQALRLAREAGLTRLDG